MSDDQLIYVSYAIGLILDLVIANAAIKMARRKGRGGRMRWGVACFLFAPLIFVLWALPNNNRNYATGVSSAQLQKCSVCGGSVSSDAKTCPNCGAKNISYHSERAGASEWLGLICAIFAILAASASILYSGGLGSPSKNGWPACDSVETKSLAEKIYKDIPMNHEIGKKIITWHSISESGPGMCDANVLSSSGDHENIHMKYSTEDGSTVMQVHLD